MKFKEYELKDHLGDVRATFNDLKYLVNGAFSLNSLETFNYYPFGMLEPTTLNSSSYRFGYNGMERDDEVKAFYIFKISLFNFAKFKYFCFMSEKEKILNKLKELKPYLNKEFSVSKMGLFGSYCDNTYTDESDIDILVEFSKPIGWKFFSLEIFLENTFKKRIDLVTHLALKDVIKNDILQSVQYI